MKNTRIILISLAILVACGGIFYFWAQDSAQEKAAQQLSEAKEKIISLVKSELNEDIKITYDFKNFVLSSQTLNIENLSVKNSFAELKIPELSISGNKDILSIKKLEKLEIVDIANSRTIAEIASLKINNLSIEKLLGSKNILAFSKNLKFENFEVLKAILHKPNQEEPPTEISRLFIGSLNSGIVGNIILEDLVFQDRKNDPKISLKSASIDNLNAGELIQSKDIFDFSNNLKFENFQLLNARISNLNQDVTPSEIALLSIRSLNSGNVENILLEGLVIQENKHDPIISLKSASLDKISDLLPLFESIDTGDSKAIGKHVGNLLDLGSFEVNGLQVKDSSNDKNALNVDSFNINLNRDDKLVNSIEIKLSGLEVDKSLLEDEYELPVELLELFKEDKFKLNTALSLNADYNISEISTGISIGFDKIGKFSIESSQGGFSRDLVNYALNNIDSISSSEFTNRVDQKTTFKSLKFSFTNEGLMEIAMREAQKNMNLTPDQMVQMVSQEIEKSGEMLSADIKKKLKQALTTFIKSRKGLAISIRSKDKDGITGSKLVDSFMNGSIWNSLELDIKGSPDVSSGAGQQQQSQNEQDAPYKGLIPTF